MAPTRSPGNPSPPLPEDAWRAISGGLRRFMSKHELTQAWIAETLKVSQPQVSYLLGNTHRERPRELTASELAAIELRVRREKDPAVVIGEILRDAGLVEDASHPAEAVRAYPHLDPGSRDDIALLIERAEQRYRSSADPDPDVEWTAAAESPGQLTARRVGGRPGQQSSDDAAPPRRRRRG